MRFAPRPFLYPGYFSFKPCLPCALLRDIRTQILTILEIERTITGMIPVRGRVLRLLRRTVSMVSRRQTYSVYPPSVDSLPNYCLALLSEVPGDDVTVVSALAVAPFCCHADLLTMSPNQLTAVAHALNDALPPSLRINVGAGSQPGETRAEIEAIVGLRPPYQHATSVRSLSQFHMQSPVTVVYHGPTHVVPSCEGMDYDGDISMSCPSPHRRYHISPAPVIRTVCTPSQAPPYPIVLGSGPAQSLADIDMDTPASSLMNLRPPYRMRQVPPRMSTPVKGSQTNSELTFGLEGLTVENVEALRF